MSSSSIKPVEGSQETPEKLLENTKYVQYIVDQCMKDKKTMALGNMIATFANKFGVSLTLTSLRVLTLDQYISIKDTKPEENLEVRSLDKIFTMFMDAYVERTDKDTRWIEPNTLQCMKVDVERRLIKTPGTEVGTFLMKVIGYHNKIKSLLVLYHRDNPK